MDGVCSFSKRQTSMFSTNGFLKSVISGIFSDFISVIHVPFQKLLGCTSNHIYLIDLYVHFFSFCMLLSLLAQKKVTKEMHPGKPLRLQRSSFTHSEKIRSQLNSLHFIPLRQNCSPTGFFLPSLTGFKGTPFDFVPSYSDLTFEFIGHGRF
jgi:hypothetical protein